MYNIGNKYKKKKKKENVKKICICKSLVNLLFNVKLIVKDI